MRLIPFTAIAAIASLASAQDATIVYRLGKDTAAVEQFNRSASKLTGEMVQRTGAAVTRTQYELTLDKGRIAAATYRRRQADGTPIPNQPVEYRFTFRTDSAVREIQFTDSTQ